ncbi:MAG: T9SS type A sorting domain-containing protein [Bacteroidales bacterium]|nr:T9SS type A sorting domain-containing protein [Bacteroidales bacterium]
MRRILLIFLLMLVFKAGLPQNILVREPVRMLALGDSYTIGQSVVADERWPEQLTAQLKSLGYQVDALKTIAQTGWRTDNLQNAVNQQLPLTGYNLVSLLIGVNNQYQGGTLQVYSTEFTQLLQQAITLAGGNPRHVFVLSIPDYAYTPFGNGNPQISAEIDEFNAINKAITGSYGVKYIDITPISRNGLAQPWLVAGDGLHPSGEMYRLWVLEILKHIEKQTGIQQDSAGEHPLKILQQGRQLSITNTGGASVIEIYSLAGSLVRSYRIPASAEQTISLSQFPAGVYLLRAFTEDGKRFTRKIILPSQF